MGTKKDMHTLVCDEHGCYNLRDILRNPGNKCTKEDCAAIESDYANYMHLSIPVAFYHSTSMYVPSTDYTERRGKKDAVVMDDRVYVRLIGPSIDGDGSGKSKSSGKKTTRKTGRKGNKTTVSSVSVSASTQSKSATRKKGKK